MEYGMEMVVAIFGHYFCSQDCLMDFVSKHTQAMLNIDTKNRAT